MDDSSDIERHDGPEPVCRGQWCCGCQVHPVGKPWGWNHEAWLEHYAAVHDGLAEVAR